MIINTRVLTYGGDGGNNLSKLELVENSRLSGSVEPDHQDPHLLLAEQSFKEGGKEVPHVASLSVFFLADCQHHSG